MKEIMENKNDKEKDVIHACQKAKNDKHLLSKKFVARQKKLDKIRVENLAFLTQQAQELNLGYEVKKY